MSISSKSNNTWPYTGGHKTIKQMEQTTEELSHAELVKQLWPRKAHAVLVELRKKHGLSFDAYCDIADLLSESNIQAFHFGTYDTRRLIYSNDEFERLIVPNLKRDIQCKKY